MRKLLCLFWMLLCFSLTIGGCGKAEETSEPNPDTLPPEQVTDLSVGSPTYGTLTLTWTTPGDLRCGRVTKYDIRWAQSAVTEENWSQCILVGGEPSPGTPGTPASLVVPVPYDGTLYFFALVSVDCAGNESKLSNCPSGRTNERPNTTRSK